MNPAKHRRHETRAALSLLVGLAALLGASDVRSDDFVMFTEWNPGINYTTGIAGFVDVDGVVGSPCEEFVFVVGGPSYEGAHTAYVYLVETAGDPQQHPDNPLATGPVAARTFTLVGSHAMTEYPNGVYYCGHENDFYVDTSGIYYGASRHGVYRWDHDWNPAGWHISKSPGTMQTLARHPTIAGHFWVGDANRNLYRWNGSDWDYMFTHPDLAGGHHDGLEIIGDSLFVSDMTSDEIVQYRLDAAGDPIDAPDSPIKRFMYTASMPVETMSYGPNRHIWVSSWTGYTIYEIGGHAIQIELDAGEFKGGACSTGLGGICEAGTSYCRNGAPVCVPDNQGSPEVCDGLDNDCDAGTPDGADDPQWDTVCQTGEDGVCGQGRMRCQGGGMVCEQTEFPSAEVCDGQDNDCNGEIDNGNPGGGATCDTGRPGVCGAGHMTCHLTNLICKSDTEASAEVCDGEDNDCNGEIDDGVLNACGLCGPVPDETCDGQDNDCDYYFDEGCFPRFQVVDDTSDEMVLDGAAGLLWQRGAPGGALPWRDALAYCRDLDYSGETDWRLPNAKELEALVDSRKDDPTIDLVAFPFTPSGVAWSATTNAGDHAAAWIVDFATGQVRVQSKSASAYVRCVRGGP